MIASKQNPFPGLNPWMQQRWPDIHTRLIAYICDSLSESLPGDLAVSAEEGVTLATDDDTKRHFADVGVRETPGQPWIAPWQPEEALDGGVLVAEPLLVEELISPTARWVEISDQNGRLITVIEVLSPANKGSSRLDYQAKVCRLRSAGVSVVEIDFIRGGTHTVAVDPKKLRRSTEGCSIICVSRDVSLASSRHEVYVTPLVQPLPGIRIPLRHRERDAALAIQPLVDRCYTMGRYWQLNYAQPPEPPLSPELAAWAAERVRALVI